MVYGWYIYSFHGDYNLFITEGAPPCATLHVLGMSSSQLTNSYFSEGFKPPTRFIYIYYLYIYISPILLHIRVDSFFWCKSRDIIFFLVSDFTSRLRLLGLNIASMWTRRQLIFTLWYPLVMTNSSPWDRWPIEIDDLPIRRKFRSQTSDNMDRWKAE